MELQASEPSRTDLTFQKWISRRSSCRYCRLDTTEHGLLLGATSTYGVLITPGSRLQPEHSTHGPRSCPSEQQLP